MEQYEYDNLIDELKEKALNGDVEALRQLGDALYQGQSKTEENVEAAFPYWKEAADLGDTELALKVGMALYTGSAGYKNDEEALAYFEIAADDDYVDGIYHAGYFYMKGLGCVKDTTKAKEFFGVTALDGHGMSQWYLGALQLIDKEDDWLHWICCAHLSGVEEATNYLNKMLQDGSFTREALDYQFELIQKHGIDPSDTPKTTVSPSTSGCYIATCVYGSYDCPSVWVLRRFRDNMLASSWYGRAFIRMYYAVSPVLVRWFGHTEWFKKMWQNPLDGLVKKLQEKGVKATPYKDRDY